ncbi:MAG TPA: GAF domain-containing protein [Anaerolineae bacterium]|nr:GAF domain-containing protein [Anaerolineae bacterium]
MANSDWRARWIASYSAGMGIVGWSLLLCATRWDSLRASFWPLMLFTGLSLLIKRLGFHVAREVTPSLVGIVDLAALFAFGPAAGAWVAALSGLVYLELRALRHHLLSWRFLLEHPLFSSGLRALMALGCGALYVRLGGTIAPTAVTWPLLVPLLTTLAVWFAMDRLAWGARAFLRGGISELRDFLRKTVPYSILIELLPLPLSIVIALAYLSMGEPAFVLLALALVAAGVLVQRFSQIEKDLREHLAELTALSDFGRALVEAQLDMDPLYELLYQYCSRIVNAPAFVLELMHPGRQLVDVAIHVEHGERQPRRTLPVTETMQWMASTREPLFSNNVKRDGLPFNPCVVGDLPQSLLMVPLLAGPQLIGALSVQSDETDAFDDRALNLLSTMANQAAMAIASARTYEAEQRRAKQLSAIGDLSRRVAATLELEKLFAYVVELIHETFHYDHVNIFTVDANTGNVIFRASTNPDIQENGFEVPQGEGIIGQVAQLGDPVLSNDVALEPHYRFLDVLADTRAELAVPLKVEERIVGVLDVQSNEKDTFSSEDLFVLQTLAAQVAIAVENARLYADRQEEAWISTALLQVAEAVGSLDSLDEILETVVRITPMLAGVDRCSILLWDDEMQEFASAKGYAIDREMELLFDSSHFKPGDLPLLDELRIHKRPILVESKADTHLIPSDLYADLHVGNLLALPLRAQAELHGAMLVDHVNPQARFSDRRQTILSGIADQAGMAIANARLHIAQREEAWVSTALLQVAQTVVSSTDLHENISRITRLTPLLVGVDCCMVFLWNEEQKEFVPYDAHGLGKEVMEAFHDLRFTAGEPPPLGAEEQGHGTTESELGTGLMRTELFRTVGIESILTEPLVSKGEPLGVLVVGYAQASRRFPARRIRIIEGIAHQTAIAIENARLHQISLEQERTTQELQLAREIQISFLPDCCPHYPGWDIAADWYAARAVGGDFYDFIVLDNEHLGLAIADVSDKGVPAALFMSLSRTLVRASSTESRSPAQVLQRVNKLMTTEAKSSMFVTLWYGVLNWRTGVLTYTRAGHNLPLLWRHAESRMDPLRSDGMALGVLENVILEERTVTMEPGDVLVLYTDGVTESINEKMEDFGEPRLSEVIAQASTQPCSDIVKTIRRAVSDYVGDQAQFDDYTLVAIKRTT